MTQITLRGNKGSALTYGELDENFTTIGLTDGMNTAAGNVAISVDTATVTNANITTLNTTSATIDDDIDIGDILIQNKSFLPAKGIHVLADDNENRWALVQLEEYIGSKPYGINNPSIIGIINDGSVESPVAANAYRNAINITGVARFGTGADDTDAVGQLSIQTNEDQSATAKGGAVKLSSGGTADPAWLKAMKKEAAKLGVPLRELLTMHNNSGPKKPKSKGKKASTMKAAKGGYSKKTKK